MLLPAQLRAAPPGALLQPLPVGELVQEVKQKPPGLWSLPLPHPALASGEGLALSEPRVPN